MDEFNDSLPDEFPVEAPQEVQRSKPRLTYYLLIGIFACVFLLSAVYLGHYFWVNKQAADNYDILASIRESMLNEATGATEPSSSAPTGSGDSIDPTENGDPTEPTETVPPTMLPDMKALYELNNDIVGWLSIPNLRVQYPVMQTPANPNYYLYRDFDGADSSAGSLYIRESCDVFAPSDNIVIYGHAMKTGDMFGRLSWYKNKSYYEKYPTFSFDTLYERHTYQIFAVFKTSGTYGVGYPYHMFNDAQSEEEFDQFIADVRGAAFNGSYVGYTFYTTDIIPQYGDKLLCLSTCEYTYTNGRFVVMAVQID